VAFRAPVLATLFLIVTYALLAMPGSANFVGEYMILLGAFNTDMAIAIIASTGVILASVYALRLYIRSTHNRTGPTVTSYDVSLRDGIVLVPLVLAILAFAVYPQKALEQGERSVRASVAQVAVGEERASARPEESR
jgi:NADH-quinone oxidoreductase subunit M